MRGRMFGIFYVNENRFLHFCILTVQYFLLAILSRQQLSSVAEFATNHDRNDTGNDSHWDGSFDHSERIIGFEVKQPVEGHKTGDAQEAVRHDEQSKN